MKSTYQVVPIIVVFVLGSGCSRSTLTEQEVREVLRESDGAVKEGDVDAIMQRFTDDAEIVAEVVSPQGKMTQRFDRAEYRAELERSLREASDYTYERRDLRVGLAPNGRSAFATSRIVESMTLMGFRFESESIETTTLVRRGGEIVITDVESRVRIREMARVSGA